jgi:hypothetical protein
MQEPNYDMMHIRYSIEATNQAFKRRQSERESEREISRARTHAREDSFAWVREGKTYHLC